MPSRPSSSSRSPAAYVVRILAGLALIGAGPASATNEATEPNTMVWCGGHLSPPCSEMPLCWVGPDIRAKPWLAATRIVPEGECLYSGADSTARGINKCFAVVVSQHFGSSPFAKAFSLDSESLVTVVIDSDDKTPPVLSTYWRSCLVTRQGVKTANVTFHMEHMFHSPEILGATTIGLAIATSTSVLVVYASTYCTMAAVAAMQVCPSMETIEAWILTHGDLSAPAAERLALLTQALPSKQADIIVRAIAALVAIIFTHLVIKHVFRGTWLFRDFTSGALLTFATQKLTAPFAACAAVQVIAAMAVGSILFVANHGLRFRPAVVEDEDDEDEEEGDLKIPVATQKTLVMALARAHEAEVAAKAAAAAAKAAEEVGAAGEGEQEAAATMPEYTVAHAHLLTNRTRTMLAANSLCSNK